MTPRRKLWTDLTPEERHSLLLEHGLIDGKGRPLRKITQYDKRMMINSYQERGNPEIVCK